MGESGGVWTGRSPANWFVFGTLTFLPLVSIYQFAKMTSTLISLIGEKAIVSGCLGVKSIPGTGRTHVNRSFLAGVCR